MKYFIIIIVCVVIIGMGVAGYFFMIKKPLSLLPSPQNDKMLSQTASEEITSLKSQIAKLQRELNESKDILSKQSLFMQKLKEDILSDNARIINLEKKGPIIAVNPSPQTKSEEKEQPVRSSNPLLNQTLPSELFKDPQFTKVFQEQVAEALKDIQQKQREEQIERFNEQLRQGLSRRIDELSKSLNLNDYQKQEFSKILTERVDKTMELSSKLRTQELSPEEYRTQRESLRNEANEKVKQILLPQQYEQYQKAEPSVNRRLLQGGRERPGNGQR